MSVHYKFKSALDYDTVTFDGLHISIGDFKKSVGHQKRFGKSTDFDLQVTNAQTKEVYVDDLTLIPKNTSLIVARVPLTAHQKRMWAREAAATSQAISKATADDSQDHSHARLAKAVDLSRVEGSEEDKIKAMMSQATSDYDPSNYMRIKGSGQVGEVPINYRCHRCHQTGHWIKNCPLVKESGEPMAEIKKSTGIPRSFMVPVAGPLVPGAMMTPTGGYAVPAIDHEAYREQKMEKPVFEEDECPVEKKPELPEDLVCSICEDLLTDAVMIPCCGNSFCDECIRCALLESEEHECPDCKDKGVSPDTLLPNRFLRNQVAKFRNDTGYIKPLRAIIPEPVRIPTPVHIEEPPHDSLEAVSPETLNEKSRSKSPEKLTESLSPSPPHRRAYHREDTPTHDERPSHSEHPPHRMPLVRELPLPTPSSYLAPPGVDDHFIPNYPPPPIQSVGPPPGNYPPRPFRGQFFRGGGGRREPDFNYHYGRPDRRPFPPERFPERVIEDPLDEFNRIMKSKDEEKRRRVRRDRSFSPRPIRRSPKPRSRSPKPRRTPPQKRRTPIKKFSRSRSRSPIMRRVRSRSFSLSPSPSTRHQRPLMSVQTRPPPMMIMRHSRSRSPPPRYAPPERIEKMSRPRMEEPPPPHMHRPMHMPRRHEKERLMPRDIEEHYREPREPERVERLHREERIEKYDDREREREREEVAKKEMEDARALINHKKARQEAHSVRKEKEPVPTPEPPPEVAKEKEPKETKVKEKKKRRESEGTKKKKHKDKDKEKKRKVKTHSKGAKKEEEKQQGEAPDTTTAEEEPKEEVSQVLVTETKVEEKPEVPVAKPENLPEPSKWEKSEDEGETSRDEPLKKSEEERPVTVEVLKRAENVIFKKAINAIKPERKVFLEPKIEEIQVTVGDTGRKAEKRKSTDEIEPETVKKKKHKKEKKKKTKKKSESSSSASTSDSDDHKKKKKKKKKKAKKKKQRSSDDSDSSSEEEKKSKKKKKKHKK